MSDKTDCLSETDYLQLENVFIEIPVEDEVLQTNHLIFNRIQYFRIFLSK